jgi:glutamine synthetase adenylyltransferase
VAGDARTGARFQKLAGSLANFARPDLPLAAFQPGWRKEIAHMRRRIEKERTPGGQDHLAIKTGAGGLMDAEFVAQTLCLAHGWHEANTLRALQRAEESKVLKEAGSLIENYRKLRRVEGILRRWSFAAESVLPDEPAPLYRVAVRCGFPDASAFMKEVAEWRSVLRAACSRVLPGLKAV